jgi:uncharacterized repeat protein (TIGR03803 family)
MRCAKSAPFCSEFGRCASSPLAEIREREARRSMEQNMKKQTLTSSSPVSRVNARLNRFRNPCGEIKAVTFAVTFLAGLSAVFNPAFAQTQVIFHELYSFPASGTNGANPETGLVQGADGNFYGTTLQAGADNYGSVFQVKTNGALTNLASFNGANGRAPYSYANLLQGSDGNFYGTAAYGGQNGNGVVFEMIPANPPAAIHSFSAATDGANPHSGLVYAGDANLYGTTANGGAYFAQDPVCRNEWGKSLGRAGSWPRRELVRHYHERWSWF